MLVMTSISILLAAFSLQAPAPVAVAAPESAIVESLDWGTTPNVSTMENWVFAGQVDEAGLERAKNLGVGVVINLRAPSEFTWDEKAAVETLGLEYFSVPVTSPFDRAAFSQIDDLVDRFSGQRVLIHCASSNRVGAWLATYLVETRGMDIERALAIGRSAGVSREPVEQAVRDYLAHSPQR